jgi:hypothetical protein
MNINHLSGYSRKLFVDRSAISRDLMSQLLETSPGPGFRRSIIVEGAGGLGKSWLLEHLKSNFEENATKDLQNTVLVLLIKSSRFKGIVDQGGVNKLALEFLNELLNQLGTSLNVEKINSSEDFVRDFITLLINRRPQPYLIMLFDGMEEVVDQTLEGSNFDVLYAFEKNFLAPLLKYPRSRLLASRRTKSTAYWKTFIIKPLTKVQKLPPLDIETLDNNVILPADQQFEKLAELRSDKKGGGFDELRTLVPYYTWRNPGINTRLIDAYLSEGRITYETLQNIIDTLLASPTGVPLDSSDRSKLFKLIMTLGTKIDGESFRLSDLNEILGFTLDNIERNTFVRRLQEYGIGTLEKYRFTIVPEIVQLIRAISIADQSGDKL